MDDRKITSRVYQIVQYEYNPVTGENLGFNEELIKDALLHETIKEYAYIRHDKDSDKQPHWHIVIKLSPAKDIDTIARWFNVPKNMVQKPKAKGKTYANKYLFFDLCHYLTHESSEEQAKGKYLYPDEDIKCSFIGYDTFRQFIESKLQEKAKRKANIDRYGEDVTVKDEYRLAVLSGEKTLAQCREENELNYVNDLVGLRRVRREYLSKLPSPEMRTNIFISGDGGMGKTLLAKVIGRQLDKSILLTEGKSRIFTIGGDNVTFEGYDGQPIIVWDEMTASDLLDYCRGARGFLRAFNTFEDEDPEVEEEPMHFNVKGDSIVLNNWINIVTSPQPFKDFMRSLIRCDKAEMYYRRIHFSLILHEEDYDIYVNRGFMLNTREFYQFDKYKTIVGNYAKIKEACGDDTEVLKECQDILTLPFIEKVTEVAEGKKKTPDKKCIHEILSKIGKEKNSELCSG